jgi:hypothetical protein
LAAAAEARSKTKVGDALGHDAARQTLRLGALPHRLEYFAAARTGASIIPCARFVNAALTIPDQPMTHRGADVEC